MAPRSARQRRSAAISGAAGPAAGPAIPARNRTALYFITQHRPVHCRPQRRLIRFALRRVGPILQLTLQLTLRFILRFIRAGIQRFGHLLRVQHRAVTGPDFEPGAQLPVALCLFCRFGRIVHRLVHWRGHGGRRWLCLGQPRQRGQRGIERARLRRSGPIRLAQLVKPRQMRQQQPRIKAPPGCDLLPVIEHRFFHPVQRAFRQHRFHMPPRQHQRPAPRQIECAIAPPRQIDPRTRHPHPRRRHPHIAVARQFINKAEFDGGREHGFNRERLKSPLFFAGGGWGWWRQQATVATYTTPRPPPLNRRGSFRLPRQSHIALRRNPPPPERAGSTLIVHRPSPSCKMPNRPSCTFRRCRKMDCSSPPRGFAGGKWQS